LVSELEDFPIEIGDVLRATFPMLEAAYEIIVGEYSVVGELEELSVEY
jgi:hypothetical protein